MADETPTQSITPWYSDKALYVTVLTALAPYIAKLFGFKIDPAEAATIILPAVSFILGHKWKSGSVLVAEIEAKTQKAIAASPPITTPTQAADALNALVK